MWCTLVVGTDWVGHSGMIGALFSQTASLGLWLLSANHGTSVLLSAVLNLAMTGDFCFS